MLWDANLIICECCEKVIPDDEYFTTETDEIICPNCWGRF